MGEGYDATLYSYAWNRPTSMVDPLGLWGGGVVAGAQGSVGNGLAGLGGQLSAGGGAFYNQDTGGTTLGTYVSYGGTAGLSNGRNQIAGLSASAGGGFFLTNAKCAHDLSGPFHQVDLNLPFISIAWAYTGGPDSTDIISITAGPSTPGFSYTGYDTNTPAPLTNQTPSFNNPSPSTPIYSPPPPNTVSTGGAS